jgi:plastocyanin
MRQLVLLAALYTLIVALVLPSSLFASDQSPAETEASPPGADEPAAPPAEEPATEPLPEETTPAEPPPVPAPEADPGPAPTPPASTTPAEPVPAVEEPPAEPAEPAEAAQAEDRAGGRKAGQKKKKVRARAAADRQVTIADFEFTPATITVQQGDEVTWANDGPSSHSATAEDGSFDTGVFGAGGSRSVTFDEAGTFSYICTPHPNMEGTVTVQAASSVGQPEEDLQDAEDDQVAAEDDLAATGDLPDTGSDVRVVGLTGLLMLALGAALRLRARARA